MNINKLIPRSTNLLQKLHNNFKCLIAPHRYIQTTTLSRPTLVYGKQLLQGYNSCLTPIDVLWGQQDMFDHVNNVVYVRWIEQSRVNMFNTFIKYTHKHYARNKELLQHLKQFMSTSSVGPILKSLNIKYRSPVTFPDTCIVGCRIHTVDKDRLTMMHRIISTQQNNVVCECEDVIVTYDYRSKTKSDMPSDVYEALKQFIKDNNTEQVIPYRPKGAE